MKIKSDFVTNSSSSSFVVAWPRKIKTLDDVQEFIPEEFAETVLHDALTQTPAFSTSKRGMKIVYEEFQTGDAEMYDNSLKNHNEKFCQRNNITQKELNQESIWQDQCWEEYNKLTEIACDNYAKKFLKDLNAGKKKYYLYVFSYNDNDGEHFSKMEHGDIFRNLKHQQVSHH